MNSRTCAIAAKRIGLLAGAVLFAAPMCAGAAVAIQGVRVHQSPDYTRVVFDTSAPVRYRVFTLEDPPRVVLDLDDTAPRDGLQLGQISVDSTSVRSIRSAVRGGKNFRIVLDVDRVVRPNAFTLQPIASYGHRLVVDLYSQAATPQQRVHVSEGRFDVAGIPDEVLLVGQSELPRCGSEIRTQRQGVGDPRLARRESIQPILNVRPTALSGGENFAPDRRYGLNPRGRRLGARCVVQDSGKGLPAPKVARLQCVRQRSPGIRIVVICLAPIRAIDSDRAAE